MKTMILIGLMWLFTLAATAQDTTKNKEKAQVTFSVPMDGTCCIEEITEGLAFEKGVKAIKCSYEKRTVQITYRQDKTDVNTLIKAFAAIDKEATVIAAGEDHNPEESSCGSEHDHSH